MANLFVTEVPKSNEALQRWLTDVVEQLTSAINTPEVNYVMFEPVHEEPAKYIEGFTVLADGTDWDPGSGKGIYRFESGTGWVFLG